MLRKVADWASIAGAVLGVAGVVFSILAFVAAKRARRSADEARRDVRNLVAADRFHHLNSSASELFSHIEHENLPVASFLARELRFEINTAITRWEFLDGDTRERFREARLTQQVGEFIRSKNQMDAKDKARVLKKCDAILAILSGESGKMHSGLEGGGSYEV
jgi:Rad3-related DNA helicase